MLSAPCRFVSKPSAACLAHWPGGKPNRGPIPIRDGWAGFHLPEAACGLNAAGVDKPDQLRELWRLQKALNERIGVHPDRMTEQERIQWILNYCRAMSQEIAELTDSVPWKWWARYQKFDPQNARVEVVDLLHFLISLAQVLGMSADDVFDAYVKKNQVNFQRQETGYTHKDESDSKHI